MTRFRTRINSLSKKSRIILANDYDSSIDKLEQRTIKNINTLHHYICGIKFNFHILLPLGGKQITRINNLAHKSGLQTIADIKLNDIGNTNKITAETLWHYGFDAVIVNPIMGPDSLKNLIVSGHKKDKGIIALCHMSSTEAKLTYELKIKLDNTEKPKRLYEQFLDWATLQHADGIIVGATFPKIIQYCKKKINKKLDIYSPGIGTQGGDIQKTLLSGSDFLIVGRSILNAKNPVSAAKSLHSQVFGK